MSLAIFPLGDYVTLCVFLRKEAKELMGKYTRHFLKEQDTIEKYQYMFIIVVLKKGQSFFCLPCSFLLINRQCVYLYKNTKNTQTSKTYIFHQLTNHLLVKTRMLELQNLVIYLSSPPPLPSMSITFTV